MITWDAAERRLTNDIEANLQAYRAAASTVVRDVLGAVEVSVEVATTPRSDGSVILLGVPMGRFALRLQVDGTQARHAPRKDFASKLRQRIEEALTHADRFASRLADVRVKVEASLARNGGMKLLLLEMTASRIVEPFDWYGAMLDAHVESLGPLLVPEVDVLQEYTARAMAGTIRSIGKDHQRLTRIRDRLVSVGAVYEIDLIAERAIVESGRTVGEVAGRLARDGAVELEDRSGHRIMVGLKDGTICLYSMLDHRTKKRPVMQDEIRAAASTPQA